MAYTCIYCDGMVICDDDPDCGAATELTLAEVRRDPDWVFAGCLCIDSVDGQCTIAKCSSTNCLNIGVFKKGEKLAFFPVPAGLCL